MGWHANGAIRQADVLNVTAAASPRFGSTAVRHCRKKLIAKLRVKEFRNTQTHTQNQQKARRLWAE